MHGNKTSQHFSSFIVGKVRHFPHGLAEFKYNSIPRLYLSKPFSKLIKKILIYIPKGDLISEGILTLVPLQKKVPNYTNLFTVL